jgi:hypothetical protein
MVKIYKIMFYLIVSFLVFFSEYVGVTKANNLQTMLKGKVVIKIQEKANEK